MPITELSKFSVKDLKNLITKFDLGSIKGSKSKLLGLIQGSEKWSSIQEEEEQIVRTFSPKQLEAQKKFKERAQSRKNPTLPVILEEPDVEEEVRVGTKPSLSPVDVVDVPIKKEVEVVSLPPPESVQEQMIRKLIEQNRLLKDVVNEFIKD